MVKNKIFLIILFLLLFSNLVLADLIMPGTKRVGYCLKITNVNEFSDYVFFLYGQYPGSNQGEVQDIFEENKCIKNLGYKLNKLSIYVINKDDFDLNNSDISKATLLSDNIKTTDLISVWEPISGSEDRFTVYRDSNGNFSLKKYVHRTYSPTLLIYLISTGSLILLIYKIKKKGTKNV